MTRALVLNRSNLDKKPYADWLANLDEVVLFTAASSLSPDPERRAAQERPFSRVVAFDEFHADPSVEWEALRLHEEQAFDLVVALSEFDLLRAARLRTITGAAGQSLESAQAFRDKLVMKTLLNAAGLPLAPFAAIPDATALYRFARRHGFPIVVKPRTGGGSVGVEVARSNDELRELVSRIPSLGSDDDAHLLAERYIEHEPIHVDGLVLDGTKVLSWPSSMGSATCLDYRGQESLASVMLDPADPLRTQAVELTDAVLGALPTPDHFIFHVELFATDGGLVVNEAASRAGGGEIQSAIRHGFGADMAESLVRRLAGEDPSTRFVHLPMRLAGWVVVYPQRGKLLSAPETCGLDGVTHYKLHAAIGAELEPAADSVDALASAVVVADNRSGAERTIEEFLDWFGRHVRVKEETPSARAPLPVTFGPGAP
ncbi:ATP-grasp domain-containing protein [Nocardiopsis rhodophaea]|uniref:ATP-grasp domain-containing protein n=1 Tax=Nocardiopsis rhodophaea TaxID=280238 RepID=UPI0031CDC9BD